MSSWYQLLVSIVMMLILEVLFPLETERNLGKIYGSVKNMCCKLKF